MYTGPCYRVYTDPCYYVYAGPCYRVYTGPCYYVYAGPCYYLYAGSCYHVYAGPCISVTMCTLVPAVTIRMLVPASLCVSSSSRLLVPTCHLNHPKPFGSIPGYRYRLGIMESKPGGRVSTCARLRHQGQGSRVIAKSQFGRSH